MLESLKRHFAGAKTALAEAMSGVAALKKKIEELKREQQHLRTGALCKTDVVKILHDAIERDAGRFLPNLRRAIAHVIHSPFDDFSGQMIAHVTAHESGTVNIIMPENLAFIFKDQIKAGVVAAIEQMDWPADCGPPLVERRKRLVVIERELAEAEAELKEISAEASAAGINIAP